MLEAYEQALLHEKATLSAVAPRAAMAFGLGQLRKTEAHQRNRYKTRKGRVASFLDLLSQRMYSPIA